MARYSHDWFGAHRPDWDTWLPAWIAAREKAGPVTLLEIGVYEARSAVWLGGTLTHTDSRLVAVDPWLVLYFGTSAPEYKARAMANIAEAGLTDRIDIRQVKSDDFFADNDASFDLCWVDGDHHYEQAKKDIANAMACTKPNGMVLVDDCYCDTGDTHHSPWYAQVYQAMDEATAEAGGFTRRGNAAVWVNA